MRIKPLGDHDVFSDESDGDAVAEPRLPWSEDAKVAVGVGVLMIFILATVTVATVVILSLR